MKKVRFFLGAAAILVLAVFNLNLTLNSESTSASVLSSMQDNSSNTGCYSDIFTYEDECVSSAIATCEYDDYYGDLCLQGIIYRDICQGYMYDAMHMIRCD